jgi:serine kinase of HPr protein (carbohydrate metabolism regulator)
MLVLEVKGQDNQEQQTKREFLSEWVRAVNCSSLNSTLRITLARRNAARNKVHCKLTLLARCGVGFTGDEEETLGRGVPLQGR